MMPGAAAGIAAYATVLLLAATAQAQTPEAAAPPQDPPPAPGQIQVDEEAIATALERALVQEGVLVLPPGVVQWQPSMTYQRRSETSPALLAVDGQLVVGERVLRRGRLVADFGLRFGLPGDLQAGINLPVGLERGSAVTRLDFAGADEHRDTISGLGDIGLSISRGLVREHGWRPDLVATLRWDTDTGYRGAREADAPAWRPTARVGTGFHEVTGTLTAARSQDPLVFVGALSFTHVFQQEGVRPGRVIGLSIGAVLAASPETSLRFFLDQTFAQTVEVAAREVPGSDQLAATFRVGASSILAARLLVDVEVAIGLTEDAPDYSVSIAFPLRF
jgi:hypothetical protein